MNLFVAATLAALAATLLAAGRRRLESVMLAAFLGLVATNFLAIAVGLGPEIDVTWGWVAYAALALDPLFLLSFVTLYPYKRRPPGVTRLLWAVLGAAIVSAGFVFFAPGLTMLTFARASATAIGNVWVVSTLAVAYASAWLLAVRTAAEAPTPELARRGGWLVAAVGVMVVPRLALVPNDFGFHRFVQSNLANGGVAQLLYEGVPELVIAAAALAAGFVVAQRHPGPHAAGLRGPLRFVVAAVALLYTAVTVLEAWIVLGGGPSFGGSIPYGTRWLVFAGILVFGILSHEIVAFHHASERVVPILGGFTGGVAAGLATAAYLASIAVQPDVIPPIAVFAGLAAVAPAAFVSRAAARSVTSASAIGTAWQRRLELYRAAAEAAWARGVPDAEARTRLERDRRAFGVSFEEARAIEHVVAGVENGPRPLALGDEPLPGLVLDSVIGEGGHGRVFLAHREPGGERVVVKELRAAGADADAARQRLLTELRPLSALSHPNIVPLLDVHASRGRYALVLGFVDGAPLTATLLDAPLKDREVRALFAQVLDALESAHALGIVHRDVKPANVLVDGAGHAFLTDFGVAALTEPDAANGDTASSFGDVGAVAGTFGYMAPEQVRGGAADTRSDLYGVGLMVYEALTGKTALDLRGYSLYDAMDRVAKPNIDLSAVPTAWRPFIQRALQTDTAARFQDAAAMRRALLDGPAATDITPPAPASSRSAAPDDHA